MKVIARMEFELVYRKAAVQSAEISLIWHKVTTTLSS